MSTAFRWLFFLPYLYSAPPLPPSIYPALRCQNATRPVRLILRVPSWAITLLSQCLGIKATICFCISDKHFIFSSTLIHPSIHPFFGAMCLSVICLVGRAAYMCHRPHSIPLCHTGLYDREGLGDSAEAYPQSLVLTCTLRQIHEQHLCIVHLCQHQGLSYLAIREMWQLD